MVRRTIASKVQTNIAVLFQKPFDRFNLSLINKMIGIAYLKIGFTIQKYVIYKWLISQEKGFNNPAFEDDIAKDGSKGDGVLDGDTIQPTDVAVENGGPGEEKKHGYQYRFWTVRV